MEHDFRRNDRLKESGFTLVEVMVTLALVAVLAAIAAPSLSQQIKRSQSKSLARGIVNHLRVARNQASSRGEVVVVQIELVNRGRLSTFRTQNNAASCRSITAASLEPVPIVVFNANTISEPYHLRGVEPLNAGLATLCFQPDGRVLQIGGTALQPTGVCTGEAFVGWTMGTPITPMDERGCGTRSVEDSELNNYWRLSVWETGQITMVNK